MMRMEPAERDPSHCQNCGSHVSAEFRRTFCDEEGLIHRCLACDSRSRINKGSAAGVDVDLLDPADHPELLRGNRTRAAQRGTGQ